MKLTNMQLKEFPAQQYNRVASKLQSMLGIELYEALKLEGCYIAGGALTSIFTNKPVNDIDVYFPSAQAFENVMLSIFNTSKSCMMEEGIRRSWQIPDDIVHLDIGDFYCRVNCITKKSVMLTNEENPIQFINYDFFKSVEALFDKYDFTCCMAAYDLKKDTFVFHEDFFLHNSQRYLKFNANTAYPLVSALRVQKYTERGYTCSKSEYLRILLAVNLKNINSWEKLFDEVGGMYGSQPEDIFDVKKQFNLWDAIEQLSNIELRDTMQNSAKFNGHLESIILKQKHAFTPELVKYIETFGTLNL